MPSPSLSRRPVDKTTKAEKRHSADSAYDCQQTYNTERVIPDSNADPTPRYHEINYLSGIPRSFSNCQSKYVLLKLASLGLYNFLRAWTNMLYRKYFCESNSWQELHNEASHNYFEK